MNQYDMKLLMHARLAVLAILLFMPRFLSGAQPSIANQVEMESINLNNLDVRWDGTPFGLNPILSARADKCLEYLRAEKRNGGPGLEHDKLRALLRDPDRFVVAHVLLTLLAEKEFGVSSEQWNHLRVVLRRDSTVIAKEQMAEIALLWGIEGDTSRQLTK